LRGEGTESMDIAIDELRDKSYACFRFFILELLFFHISSFLLMWIYYPFIVALVINIILLGFLMMFVKNGYEIYRDLNVGDEDAVSAKFQSFNTGGFRDLDNNRQAVTTRGYAKFE
jgi:uncharacterized membrane protein YfhO